MINDEHSIPQSDGKSELIKISFSLPAEDRAAGVGAENLWAVALDDDKYKIDSIPFYIYGISLNDVVYAEASAGRLIFRKIASRSGHSTYRILLKDSADFDDARVKPLWLALEELGCTCEIAKRRWIAIDVPPTTNVFSVYKVLEAGEEQQIWTFEEAHCGHPV